MNFVPKTSKTFRGISGILLAYNVFYFFLALEGQYPSRYYLLAVKLFVCFTCVISYFNNQGKMLSIVNRGLLIVDFKEGERPKAGWLFFLIAIIYNPLVPVMHSRIGWAIVDALIAVYFLIPVIKAAKAQSKSMQ